LLIADREGARDAERDERVVSWFREVLPLSEIMNSIGEGWTAGKRQAFIARDSCTTRLTGRRSIAAHGKAICSTKPPVVNRPGRP